MSLSMTWGGTTLPLPDGNPGSITEHEIPIGRAVRMADGTLRVQTTAHKRRITVRWSGLTASEWATLQAAYRAYRTSPRTLVLPDGDTLTVLVATNALQEAQWYDWAGEPIRDSVTLIFEEV